MNRTFAVCTAFLLALASASASSAAPEPVTLNAVLSLTGPAAFLGTKEQQSLRVLESVVNANGGIQGRPIAFDVADDQSVPQTAVQLVSGLIAKKVPLIVGPTFTATCAAVTPLVESAGPVTYCLSPGIRPKANTYMFASAPPFDDATPVVLRYFKSRGWTKVALLAATDATGQDAEQSFDHALTLPDLRGIQLVDREHFTTTDVTVAAQLARIKAAAPDAIITYCTGTSFGTVLRGVSDAGIDKPVYGTGGNMTLAQMQQYGSFLPKELFFNGAQGIVPDPQAGAALRRAQTVYFDAVKRAGLHADFGTQLSWDPAMIFIDALRHLGPNATAEQVHAYLEHLRGWTGIEGTYDFSNGDQRGIHESAVAVFRWDPSKNDFVSVYVGGRQGGR